MEILAWIGIILFGLALIIVMIGFIMPREARMKREIIIKADKKTVFDYANSLKKFVDHWSPWTDKDPEMETTYEGPAEGVGAIYNWKGHPKKVGYGTMKIIAVEEPEKVVSFLSFGGRGDAEVSVIIEDLSADEVKVTWAFSADNGYNPLSRIFGGMMDKFLGPDFEKGLQRLKDVCEK